jgi:hypothetical protein
MRFSVGAAVGALTERLFPLEFGETAVIDCPYSSGDLEDRCYFFS